MPAIIDLPGGDFAPLPWQQVVLRLNRPGLAPVAYPAGALAEAATTPALRAAIQALAEGETGIVFISAGAEPATISLERVT